MAKLMGRIMTVVVVMVIALVSSGCSTTTNVRERGDKPTVSEKTTVTETKTTRD